MAELRVDVSLTEGSARLANLLYRGGYISALRKWADRCEDMHYSSPDQIANLMRAEITQLEELL